VAGTVKAKETCTLKHQANLGEDVGDVEVQAGAELTVLQEWELSYLVKNDEGQLFNVSKKAVEPAD
jgi:hypothetical protein